MAYTLTVAAGTLRRGGAWVVPLLDEDFRSFGFTVVGVEPYLSKVNPHNQVAFCPRICIEFD